MSRAERMVAWIILQLPVQQLRSALARAWLSQWQRRRARHESAAPDWAGRASLPHA